MRWLDRLLVSAEAAARDAVVGVLFVLLIVAAMALFVNAGAWAFGIR